MFRPSAQIKSFHHRQPSVGAGIGVQALASDQVPHQRPPPCKSRPLKEVEKKTSARYVCCPFLLQHYCAHANISLSCHPTFSRLGGVGCGGSGQPGGRLAGAQGASRQRRRCPDRQQSGHRQARPPVMHSWSLGLRQQKLSLPKMLQCVQCQKSFSC